MPPDWQLWVNDDSMEGVTIPATPGAAYPADATFPPVPPVPPLQYPYQAYGQSGQPMRAGTNGFAIAGFILGIIGGVLLSVIFCITALVQIGRRPQGGKGLAIAGLVLSGVWAVVIAVIIGIAVTSGVNRSTGGTITSRGRVNIFSLRVGDCFQNPAASQRVNGVTDVLAVPCTTPHNAQVFAQFDATDASYPGSSALIKESQHGCQARVAGAIDKTKITSTMTLRFLFPEQQSWADGRRTIACLVVDATKDLTSSLLVANPAR